MSTKRRYSITASEDDVVPVMALFSKSHGIPKKSYLAMLACDTCNTTIVGANSHTPFCPCCSNEMHASSEDLLEQDKKTVENMEEIATCDNCDVTIAVPKDIEASFHDNAFYCPGCSSAVNLVASKGDEDEEEEESNSNLDETVDEDNEALFNNEENEGGSEDSETSSEDNTNTDNSNENNSQVEEGSEDNTNKEEASNSNEEEVPKDNLNANLISYLSNKGGGSTSLVASPGRDKWFLFVDNYPVAVAEKNNASENVQNMFSSDKFSTAWETATEGGITMDVLNDFGFKATTVSVPVDEAVRQNMEASINEATRKYHTTAADVRSRFERCFGIAAVGINKNVFKEPNPVKTALVASLKRLRVNNPESLVANAFANHGTSYLSSIALKASELMDNSDETLDALAKTVDESKEDSVVEEKDVIPNITPFPSVQKTTIVEDAVIEKKPMETTASDDNDDERYSRIFSSIARRHS